MEMPHILSELSFCYFWFYLIKLVNFVYLKKKVFFVVRKNLLCCCIIFKTKNEPLACIFLCSSLLFLSPKHFLICFYHRSKSCWFKLNLLNPTWISVKRKTMSLLINFWMFIFILQFAFSNESPKQKDFKHIDANMSTLFLVYFIHHSNGIPTDQEATAHFILFLLFILTSI